MHLFFVWSLLYKELLPSLVFVVAPGTVSFGATIGLFV